MRAGRLRHRIEIQSVSKTYDAGDMTRTWLTDDTVWGAIDHAGGGEAFRGYKIHPETEYIVTIRYYDGLTSANRLKWNGHIFDIVDVQNVAFKDREMLIECVEQE